jgi:hypothetical protein
MNGATSPNLDRFHRGYMRTAGSKNKNNGNYMNNYKNKAAHRWRALLPTFAAQKRGGEGGAPDISYSPTLSKIHLPATIALWVRQLWNGSDIRQRRQIWATPVIAGHR